MNENTRMFWYNSEKKNIVFQRYYEYKNFTWKSSSIMLSKVIRKKMLLLMKMVMDSNLIYYLYGCEEKKNHSSILNQYNSQDYLSFKTV